MNATSPSVPVETQAPEAPQVVMLSGWKFVAGCAGVAALIVLLRGSFVLPKWFLALEIFSTVIGLFVFGSFKYQIHKNALTFGMWLIITATFFTIWWPGAMLRQQLETQGASVLWPFVHAHFLTFKGLDELLHADTMLFILGLTFFVCVIAQTRLLESITLYLLRKSKGYVLPTVLAVTAVVAFSSGILDGVSMIGLTIRTLIIVLMLAGAKNSAMFFAVMVCTVITTVSGMWLAYGEPPNLIMKSNLTLPGGESILTNVFFLKYCLPGAVASFLVVAYNLRKRLAGTRVDMKTLDVIDANAPTVRFLQAQRHGEVLTRVEAVEHHAEAIGSKVQPVLARMQKGESLGLAMVHEEVPEDVRKQVLGHYTSEELGKSLDWHYMYQASNDEIAALGAERDLKAVIKSITPRRVLAQQAGALGLVVFVVLLIAHSFNHAIPLFVAPFVGFAIAMLGIFGLPKMRRLALREARHEFAEYYFLLPLFFSLFLLTKVGFFDQLQGLLRSGIAAAGRAHVAFAQFIGCTFLSAILDNNVVADFGSRALHGLDIGIIYLFASAQIAGYAVGGCWTHIGCAQSVVAFSFIRREIDAHFTPVQWIKEMTPVMIQLIVVMALLIYGMSLVFP